MNEEMNSLNSDTTFSDLICFSHLRWDFVYQRPQHLLSRFAKDHRVFVIEEPEFVDAAQPSVKTQKKAENLFVLTPQLPIGMSAENVEIVQRTLLDGIIEEQGIQDYVSWYYTPMMFAWSDHLEPVATVYDCMDELSGFKNAPPELQVREKDLFSAANLVFTGGNSLYQAKRRQHKSVHPFPSSIDKEHFAQAHEIEVEMPDQKEIGSPRIGFIGVIDERMDIELLRAIADLRPQWNFVMIGPVVKIDPADLPAKENIYYLGGKSYDELPAYIAGWDVAMMPFALNDSTKFISPTKTPEYLAAGKPVVSTPITDVVSPYGDEKLVYIASTANEFITAIEMALEDDAAERHARVEQFLREMSWDNTFREMKALIDDVAASRLAAATSA